MINQPHNYRELHQEYADNLGQYQNIEHHVEHSIHQMLGVDSGIVQDESL